MAIYIGSTSPLSSPLHLSNGWGFVLEECKVDGGEQYKQPIPGVCLWRCQGSFS